MKVAVTGATGFIGRHVLSELVSHAVDVVAVVRGILPVNSILNDIDSVQVDLDCPPPNVFDVMGRPDILIHLAWGGLPNYRSLHHFEHELPMQYQFLSGLVRSGLSGLVVPGTCFEYGMQSGQLSETMETHPANPYGFAKDTLRRQLQYLRKSQPFVLTWTRLFYLYGDGQAESSLLPQLKRAVEQGYEVFNMSGGEQLRDYLSVTDVAKNLVTLALNRADIGVVNISSGKPISVRKLVEGWIAENHWNINLNLGHYPYPDYEPLAFWGDRGKLDSFLRQCEQSSHGHGLQLIT
jgi:nucleoside-diphosphate-sugar epimerase